MERQMLEQKLLKLFGVNKHNRNENLELLEEIKAASIGTLIRLIQECYGEV